MLRSGLVISLSALLLLSGCSFHDNDRGRRGDDRPRHDQRYERQGDSRYSADRQSRDRKSGEKRVERKERPNDRDSKRRR